MGLSMLVSLFLQEVIKRRQCALHLSALQTGYKEGIHYLKPLDMGSSTDGDFLSFARLLNNLPHKTANKGLESSFVPSNKQSLITMETSPKALSFETCLIKKQTNKAPFRHAPHYGNVFVQFANVQMCKCWSHAALELHWGFRGNPSFSVVRGCCTHVHVYLRVKIYYQYISIHLENI